MAGTRSIPGSEFVLECDMVIKSLGQKKQGEFAKKMLGPKTDDRGRITVDATTMQTSNPKFYAGGDCVNGGREVVNAVAHGKRAAWAIDKNVGRGHRSGWLVEERDDSL